MFFSGFWGVGTVPVPENPTGTVPVRFLVLFFLQFSVIFSEKFLIFSQEPFWNRQRDGSWEKIRNRLGILPKSKLNLQFGISAIFRNRFPNVMTILAILFAVIIDFDGSIFVQRVDSVSLWASSFPIVGNVCLLPPCSCIPSYVHEWDCLRFIFQTIRWLRANPNSC